MLVQKLDTATGDSKASLLELADMSTDAKNSLGGGSQLDTTQKTFFVSASHTKTGHFYTKVDDALTDADTAGTPHTIEVAQGEYEENILVDNGHNVKLAKNAYIIPLNTAFPAVEITSGSITGEGVITENGKTTTAHLVEINGDAIVKVDKIESDFGAVLLDVDDVVGGRKIEIRADRIDDIQDISSGGLYADIRANTIQSLDLDGASDSEYYVETNEYVKDLVLDNGYLNLKVKEYLVEDTRLFEISGGSLIASGRLANYSDGSNNSNGDGFPIAHVGGDLRLINFFGKNGSGGLVYGANLGELIIGNSVLEAGAVGGGTADPTIGTSSLNDYKVTYINSTSLNSDPHSNVGEQVPTNKVQDSSVKI